MIIRRRHTAKDFPPRKTGVCWLYILTAGGGEQVVKVGIADDLRTRLVRIERQYDRAYDIHLRCAFPLAETGQRCAAVVEQAVHVKLYKHRIGGCGDWFLVDADTAEAVVLDAIGRPLITQRFPRADKP